MKPLERRVQIQRLRDTATPGRKESPTFHPAGPGQGLRQAPTWAPGTTRGHPGITRAFLRTRPKPHCPQRSPSQPRRTPRIPRSRPSLIPAPGALLSSPRPPARSSSPGSGTEGPWGRGQGDPGGCSSRWHGQVPLAAGARIADRGRCAAPGRGGRAGRCGPAGAAGAAGTRGCGAESGAGRACPGALGSRWAAAPLIAMEKYKGEGTGRHACPCPAAASPRDPRGRRGVAVSGGDRPGDTGRCCPCPHRGMRRWDAGAAPGAMFLTVGAGSAARRGSLRGRPQPGSWGCPPRVVPPVGPGGAGGGPAESGDGTWLPEEGISASGAGDRGPRGRDGGEAVPAGGAGSDGEGAGQRGQIPPGRVESLRTCPGHRVGKERGGGRCGKISLFTRSGDRDLFCRLNAAACCVFCSRVVV